MHERIENAGQSRPERAFPAVVAALCLDRPINQERAPHDGVAVHESPVTAVLAMFAIVSHREILSWWDHDFVTLNIFPDLRLPFRDRIGRHHLTPSGGKRVIE